MHRNHPQRNSGSILVTVLIIMAVASITLVSLYSLATLNLQRASQRLFILQAQYSAESGADAGISRLNSGNLTPYSYSASAGQPGSETLVLQNGSMFRTTYQTMLQSTADPNTILITSIGRVYSPASATNASYLKKVRITAKRSSGSVGSSIVSRNIVEIASSVKNVTAKDLYVNNYIQTDKNVNVLTVQNVTVGGNDATAGKCSIAGPGKLQQPSSYTNPGQTTTVLNLAYNNCISAGSLLDSTGASNPSAFTIKTNQTNVTQIQSTNIPWNYVMDSSYVAAPAGCNDWVGSTITIPSTAGSHATHYPDTGSGVSSSCGSSGTINLGTATVTINDNAHLRANLCSSSSPCSPTFNNPTGSMKYVFVEGTLAFDAITTAPGSAPIVFVVYGTDPSALSGTCPLGGAAYLDKTASSQINAPAAYIIAVNGGFCANGTKFGSSKALGGVSGKNIYIATSSGTPFDLSFDPSFPVSQIPINLSWKAATYEQL